MSEEVVDAEVVTGTDIVPAQPTGTLFRTDDPVEVLERATRVAQALKAVIDQQGLVSKIQGREHVRVEGWTTLGSMLGVVPVVEWTRKTEDGWEARVIAQTLDGRTIGAAEASCSKSERTWKSRDDYALRSMAQTRATSKALRGPLGFVVTLAGYEATPAEEMPADVGGGSDAAQANPASEKQLKYLKSLFKRHKASVSDIRTMLRGAGVQVADDANPVPVVDTITAEQASMMIDFASGKEQTPTGESDVPAPPADEFVHPPERPMETLG